MKNDQSHLRPTEQSKVNIQDQQDLERILGAIEDQGVVRDIFELAELGKKEERKTLSSGSTYDHPLVLKF